MAISISGSGTMGTMSSGGITGGATIVQGTAVASTSGTSISFTGIPTWAKRITVMLNGVSTNGANDLIFQVGSGSTTTTGYSCQRAYLVSATASASTTYTDRIAVLATTNSSDAKYGHVVLTNVTGNTWIATAQGGTMNTVYSWSSGGIALGGALDRVVISASGGVDTFDAGSINILYE